MKEKIVTLAVYECSEFHSLGESHEGIKTPEQAIALFNSIPSERMNGIKCISIVVTNPDDSDDSCEYDLVVGKHIDLTCLEYYEEITSSEKARLLIKELITLLPSMEVIGTM